MQNSVNTKLYKALVEKIYKEETFNLPYSFSTILGSSLTLRRFVIRFQRKSIDSTILYERRKCIINYVICDMIFKVIQLTQRLHLTLVLRKIRHLDKSLKTKWYISNFFVRFQNFWRLLLLFLILWKISV